MEFEKVIGKPSDIDQKLIYRAEASINTETRQNV